MTRCVHQATALRTPWKWAVQVCHKLVPDEGRLQHDLKGLEATATVRGLP